MRPQKCSSGFLLKERSLFLINDISGGRQDSNDLGLPPPNDDRGHQSLEHCPAQSRPLKHPVAGELGRGLDLHYEGEVDERESGG